MISTSGSVAIGRRMVRTSPWLSTTTPGSRRRSIDWSVSGASGGPCRRPGPGDRAGRERGRDARRTGRQAGGQAHDAKPAHRPGLRRGQAPACGQPSMDWSSQASQWSGEGPGRNLGSVRERSALSRSSSHVTPRASGARVSAWPRRSSARGAGSSPARMSRTCSLRVRDSARPSDPSRIVAGAVVPLITAVSVRSRSASSPGPIHTAMSCASRLASRPRSGGRAKRCTRG